MGSNQKPRLLKAQGERICAMREMVKEETRIHDCTQIKARNRLGAQQTGVAVRIAHLVLLQEIKHLPRIN